MTDQQGENGSKKPGLSVMERIRLILYIAVAVVIVIIVLQNTGSVETKLLFFKVTAPLALLLFGNLVLGFVVGVVAANRMVKRGEPRSRDRVD